MKRLKALGFLLTLTLMTIGAIWLLESKVNAAVSAHSYPTKVPFEQIVYLEHGGKGSQTGETPDNAVALADGDLWVIPAQTVIEKVYMVIDTALAGTTNFDVGDDDDADGYIDGSLSVTLGTAGMYGWDVKNAGAYLRIQTAGATDAADIYVVPNAKYYSASGKEVKLDVTTASTAGKARVVIQGYVLGTNP